MIFCFNMSETCKVPFSSRRYFLFNRSLSLCLNLMFPLRISSILLRSCLHVLILCLILLFQNDVNSSNKINNFEITRNFSMKLWMERKEKGQNNLTQLKQPPFGERYGRKKSVTMRGRLGWRKLSRNSVQ